MHAWTPRFVTAVLTATIGLASTSGCPASPPPSSGAAEAGAEGKPPTPAAPATHEGPAFVAAGEGELTALIVAERARTDAADQQLVVYVGAHWCEPCQYFHDAVDDGRLDQAFPTLRLLEFDLDLDRDRLAEAGYASRMIPLFVAPRPDGRGGPRRMEGGIKGPGAVDNIRPRLAALLEAAAADAR